MEKERRFILLYQKKEKSQTNKKRRRGIEHMVKENAELLKDTLSALCKISGRRTSDEFAFKVIDTIISSLNYRYQFFDHINVKDTSNPDEIKVSAQINDMDSSKIFKAIETVIRIVHMDLEDNAGLYFIKEFKEQINQETLFELMKNGVDLNVLEMEQQHVYRYRQKKKKMAGDPSLLGYTWKDVSNWKYDDFNNVCILYDTHDNILDKLNLDAIIKEHINRLTGSDKIDDILELQTEQYEKEFQLLRLLHQKDMDIDTAMSLLQVSQQDLEHMIDRLLNLGLLEYLDFDVVKLSEKGLKYINTNR